MTSVSQLQPALGDDQAARLRALDPAQSFIVQAPAGSGKTELLVQRMLRLLATVEKPTEVLAITFTKKAAGEMRARVLNALEEASQSAEPATSPARERWQLAREVLARDQKSGWRITDRPAQLNIDTFDAFSLRIAKLAPLEADGPNPALYSLEEDASESYREAARRALLDPDNLSDRETANAAEQLLVALDNRVESVIESIATLLSKRALWIDRFVDDSDDAIANFRTTIKVSVERELGELVALWPSTETARVCALAAYAEGHVADPSKREGLRGLTSASLSSNALASLDEWTSLADFLLTEKGEWRKSINVRDGFPKDSESGLGSEQKSERRDAKTAMIEVIAALREVDATGMLASLLHRARGLPDLQAIARQETVLRASLRLVKIAAAELQLIERSRASTDFSGIAIAAKVALNNHREEVFSRLDSKISHILVDEFQDTNPSQLSLLEALVDPWSPGDSHTLFIVGDPMQSIYAFRDADVSIFTEAWAQGLRRVALSPLTLVANYRSRPNLIQWVNEALNSVFTQAPTRVDLPVVPFARALATRDQGSELARVNCADGVVWYADPDTEAEAIADEIARLQAVSGQARIAVIVRARQHADAVMRTLEARQIAFTAQEMSPWTERSLIRDLVSLTYVLAQAEDRLSWYSWLRSPVVGLSLEALSYIAELATPRFFTQGVADTALLDRLSQEDRVRLTGAQVALARSHAGSTMETLANRVFQVFLDCGGEALVPTADLKDEVEAYLSLLDDVCTDGFLPPRALLEARIAKSYRSFTVAPRATAHTGGGRPSPLAVEILTIHKAKGLEWDYVFLPQFNKGTPADKRQLITWSFVRSKPGKNGRFDQSYQSNQNALVPAAQLLVAAKDARRKSHRSVFDFVNDRGAALREEEAKRLLYVAVTRAREGLWISASAHRPAAGYPRGSLARLLDVADTTASAQAEVRDDTVDTVHVASKRLFMSGSLCRIPLDRLPGFNDSTTPAVLDGSENRELSITDAPHDLEAPGKYGEPSEREAEIALGIVGHKLIEGLARARAAKTSFDFEERHVRRALRDCGCPAAQVDESISILRDCLAHMQSSSTFAFIHSSDQLESADEAPLAAVHEEVLLMHSSASPRSNSTFRVDRTFVAADGVRWIVDYKFSARAEAEPHRQQMNRYVALFRAMEPAREVKAALYFPRLDIFQVL